MTGGESIQSTFKRLGKRPGRSQRLGFGAIVGLIAILMAAPSTADWKVYVSGGLGISGAVIDTDGDIPAGPPDVPLDNNDNDSSPLVDGAVGLEIPMDELLPREWLMDIWLPNWPLRFELEAAGLREFEVQTDQNQSNGETYFTEWSATTTFVNVWLDIPLIEMWRPVQYLGGLGRQPRLRQWLEPGSFFLGSGVGFSYLDISGTSNILSGRDELFDFAWNVGAGVNYALTDKIDLSFGYRYVGLGEQDVDIELSGVDTGDKLTYEPQIHELRVQIRVEVFEFLNPWR